MSLDSKNLQHIAKMRPIGIIDEKKNDEVIDFMNSLLANEYLLFTKTLNYHWNFRGPRFASMHGFLGDHYNQLLTMMDDTAERIKVLGGLPLSTAKGLVQESIINESPGKVPSSSEMIALLLQDHHTIQQLIRNKVKGSDDFFSDDPGTEDFVTGLLQQHEKMSWMLKSTLG